MTILNKTEDWDLIKTEIPILNRLHANFELIAIINNVAVIKFSGKPSKKEIVIKNYKIYKQDFVKLVNSFLNTKNVVIKENLDEVKLDWLKKLIVEFGPRKIDFNITKN